MADRPVTKTRRLTREKLASFLPSHELIKAFEALISDTTVTLPDAIENLADDSDSLLAAASFIAPRSSPTIPSDASDLISTAAFIAPRAQAPTYQADASDILATQIFGP